MEKTGRCGDGAPRGPVLHIVVVGFHHKKGCQFGRSPLSAPPALLPCAQLAWCGAPHSAGDPPPLHRTPQLLPPAPAARPPQPLPSAPEKCTGPLSSPSIVPVGFLGSV
ncbi:hypothetical protein P7K49_024851 [Saguinus oedipus]|uniref:Uncharacterized protein n=1 Tax=Saguinus oedipus TaxID=9490 RepID=A0ABQ9UFF1_SAGOE|nr:hypothetical protein P7K49_024851 [Saguinus oedipus]